MFSKHYFFLLFQFYSNLELAGAQYEPNPVAKEEKFKLLKSETIGYFLGKLDAIAAENNGHFALKKFTWADVYFTGMSNYLSFMAQEDITANYPHLKKVIENTFAAPGIKEWVEKRPKVDH